jgi:hypothetical protein
VDVEWDGQPTLLAGGDDSTATTSDVSDEDGIVDLMLFDLDSDSTCISVASVTGGLIDAWIDWDFSGTFDNDEYWSGSGGPSFVHPGETEPLCFTLPGDARGGRTYGRLRISSTGGLNAYGPAPDGEVEDWTVVVSRGVTFDVKVYLEGPYSGGGQMSASPGAHVPLAQPFNVPPWSYPGGESFVTLPDNAVDWLLMELRSDSTAESTIEQQAVLLRGDGSVVDTAGMSPGFGGVTDDSVYVTLRSRNHLPAMTPEKVKIIDGVWTHDFTVSANAAFSGDGPGLKELFDGPFALFAGDANADGVVQSLDFNIYISRAASGATGYQTADFNLDGQVQALDFNLYLANTLLGASSQVP